MATIHEEVLIDVEPAEAWSALADWGALHERLARGFVVATRLDGADRIVTFASGVELREVLVTRDADARRLVWSVVGGPYTHHNGAAQVLPAPDGQSRFVWIADLLPDAAAAPTAQAMRLGLAAIKETLESSTDPRHRTGGADDLRRKGPGHLLPADPVAASSRGRAERPDLPHR